MDRVQRIFDIFFAPCSHIDSVQGKCVKCLTDRRDVLCPDCHYYLNVYNHYIGLWKMECRCYTGQSLRRMINVERERRILEESRARRIAEGHVTAGDLNALAPKAVSTEDKEVSEQPREVRPALHRLREKFQGWTPEFYI